MLIFRYNYSRRTEAAYKNEYWTIVSRSASEEPHSTKSTKAKKKKKRDRVRNRINHINPRKR